MLCKTNPLPLCQWVGLTSSVSDFYSMLCSFWTPVRLFCIITCVLFPTFCLYFDLCLPIL